MIVSRISSTMAKKRTHKQKNPGDHVPNGIACLHCGRVLFYVSSVKRHLECAHQYDEKKAKEYTDELRLEVYGEEGKEVEGSRMCPIEACRAEFT